MCSGSWALVLKTLCPQGIMGLFISFHFIEESQIQFQVESGRITATLSKVKRSMVYLHTIPPYLSSCESFRRVSNTTAPNAKKHTHNLKQSHLSASHRKSLLLDWNVTEAWQQGILTTRNVLSEIRSRNPIILLYQAVVKRFSLSSIRSEEDL